MVQKGIRKSDKLDNGGIGNSIRQIVNSVLRTKEQVYEGATILFSKKKLNDNRVKIR